MRATPTSASAIAINLCKALTNFLIFSQNSLAISVNRGNNNSNNNVASQHEDLHNGCRLLPTKRRAWPMLQQTRAMLTHEIEVCVRVCAGVCVCISLCRRNKLPNYEKVTGKHDGNNKSNNSSCCCCSHLKC